MAERPSGEAAEGPSSDVPDEGPKRQRGESSGARVDAETKATLARLAIDALKPYYRQKQIDRDRFKAIARAVTEATGAMLVGGEVQGDDEALRKCVSALVMGMVQFSRPSQ